MTSERFVLITGCSGGGKSALVEALAGLGHAVVPEPGRRIVRDELSTGGRALPWLDPEGFARRAVAVARDDLEAARAAGGLMVFDRGLVDAAVALEAAGGPGVAQTPGAERSRAREVFVAPAWPGIHRQDAERRHGLEEARAGLARLEAALPVPGYRLVRLPMVTVAERVAFVLSVLGVG